MVEKIDILEKFKIKTSYYWQPIIVNKVYLTIQVYL